MIQNAFATPTSIREAGFTLGEAHYKTIRVDEFAVYGKQVGFVL